MESMLTCMQVAVQSQRFNTCMQVASCMHVTSYPITVVSETTLNPFMELLANKILSLLTFKYWLHAHVAMALFL